MTYLRNNKGRFRKSKAVLILVVILIVYGLYVIAVNNELNIKNVQVNTVNADIPLKDKYTEKIAKIKEEMLQELSLGCETKGVKEPDGQITFDTNGKASLGVLQFQVDTVIYYVNKYEGRTITKREAIEIAINPERARALAEKIIFTNPNDLSNWKICSDKLNLKPKAELINELQRNLED